MHFRKKKFKRNILRPRIQEELSKRIASITIIDSAISDRLSELEPCFLYLPSGSISKKSPEE